MLLGQGGCGAGWLAGYGDRAEDAAESKARTRARTLVVPVQPMSAQQLLLVAPEIASNPSGES
eukprot:6396823-Prorocentrum_lima.AAC.1